MNRTSGHGTRAPVYALHAFNTCPTCDNSQWFVGRIIAECACCGDTLPINASLRPRPLPQVQAA